jgi:hypothetical protein
MMRMASSFKFLSISEFEALSPEEQRAYITEATAELERTKVDPAAGGWDTLFRRDQQQTQQQSRSKDDKPD